MEPLIHLALVWISVYVALILAAKTRITAVFYFLAMGALMVNLHWLPEETDPFIEGFAEIGILMIMFSLGFEENTKNFIISIKRSWSIALFGALAPFVVTYSVAQFFWGDVHVSIMCGLTMTATAVSLTMMVLRSEGLQRSRVATGIMTSAILDDIGSLALVAILVPIASGQDMVSGASISLILAKVLLFFVFVFIAGKWIFPHQLTGRSARIPLLSRYGVKQILSFEGGEHAALAVLLLVLLVGLLAHYLGFHPAVGAYMAGLIFKEEYFQLHKNPKINRYEDIKKIFDSIAFSWIGPVFFVVLGTKIVFDWDILTSVIPQVITLTLAVFVAQVTSASLAARYIAGFNKNESVMIGFGMLGRAELAFVVMGIAYIQHSILTTEAFYTLIFTAFLLNFSVPVLITLWKPRLKKSSED